jgi:hypothetical protein
VVDHEPDGLGERRARADRNDRARHQVCNQHLLYPGSIGMFPG